MEVNEATDNPGRLATTQQNDSAHKSVHIERVLPDLKSMGYMRTASLGHGRCDVCGLVDTCAFHLKPANEVVRALREISVEVIEEMTSVFCSRCWNIRSAVDRVNQGQALPSAPSEWLLSPVKESDLERARKVHAEQKSIQAEQQLLPSRRSELAGALATFSLSGTTKQTIDLTLRPANDTRKAEQKKKLSTSAAPVNPLEIQPVNQLKILHGESDEGRFRKYLERSKILTNTNLPVMFAKELVVLCIGKVEPNAKYHKKSTLLPVGFMSLREFQNVDRPQLRSTYLCETVAGEDALAKPRFRVTLLKKNGKFARVFEGKSPKTVWARILRKCLERRSMLKANADSFDVISVNGKAMFGYTHPHVQCMLAGTKEALRCKKYMYPHINFRKASLEIFTEKKCVVLKRAGDSSPTGQSKKVRKGASSSSSKEPKKITVKVRRKKLGRPRKKRGRPRKQPETGDSQPKKKKKRGRKKTNKEADDETRRASKKIKRTAKKQKLKAVVSSESALDSIALDQDAFAFVCHFTTPFQENSSAKAMVADPNALDWEDGDFQIEARSE